MATGARQVVGAREHVWSDWVPLGEFGALAVPRPRGVRPVLGFRGFGAYGWARRCRACDRWALDAEDAMLGAWETPEGAPRPLAWTWRTGEPASFGPPPRSCE